VLFCPGLQLTKTAVLNTDFRRQTKVTHYARARLQDGDTLEGNDEINGDAHACSLRKMFIP